MRRDPIEFRVTGTTLGARKMTRHELGTIDTTIASAAPVAVIDEAFAGLANNNIEREQREPQQPLNQTLVAEIAKQLAALDRQREQLASLLRSVKLDSLSG